MNAPKAIARRAISPDGPCGDIHLHPKRKAPALCGRPWDSNKHNSGDWDGWADAACSDCMAIIIDWCDRND